MKAVGEEAAEDKMVDNINDSMDMNLGKLQEIVRDREIWYAAVMGLLRVRITEQLNYIYI